MGNDAWGVGGTTAFGKLCVKDLFDIELRLHLLMPEWLASSKGKTFGSPDSCPVRWATMSPKTIQLG